MIDELENNGWKKIVRSSVSDKIQLRNKLRVAPASLVWAREKWGHRIASLFLERKDSLDRASCRLPRSKNKDLLMKFITVLKW